ncbi:PKD domain-containing protein [Candidatus Pacearchaeota archaeon]|nr:PKD domain-containing protein [Candidatus Pacearchaeota archaeon]
MKKAVIFLLLVILVSNFISADFTNGNLSRSIEKKYPLGSSLRGWINISLNEESVNSLFETGFGDGISLVDLMDLNKFEAGVNYTCSPLDCASDYSSVDESGESIKEITLGSRESKVFGLRFLGETIDEINGFSMNIQSNAPESTFKQLFIDVLADGENDWESSDASGNFYNEDFGCFDPLTQTLGETLIITNSFCEKINIPIAPEVEIGAYITDPTNPSASFRFTIDNENGNSASCDVSVLRGGRIGCVPEDFKIDKQEDYYVCIKNNEDDPANYNYKIKFEQAGEICGYATSKQFPKDFQIFAKPGKFAALGTIALNELDGEIGGYILDKYNGKCANECIVPIRITSGKNQQQAVTISDVHINYEVDGTFRCYNEEIGICEGGNFPIHNISETPAKITSGFLKILLDYANFSVPGNFGRHNLSLSLNDEPIFSETIEIEKVPQIVSLSPMIAIAALPTEFKVRVNTFNSSARIINYEWDFGDDSPSQKTTENKTTYTYTEIGEYVVTIMVTDSNRKSSSKSFNIEIATPRNAVNKLLKRNLDNLNNIKAQIENLSLFEQNSLDAILNLDDVESILSDIQQRNATAGSDDNDYISIMADLVTLSIPSSIDITKNVESIPFFPSEESVNLQILKKIGGGNYGNDSEKYTQAVLAWNAANSQTKISSKEFTANFEDNPVEILNVFKLQISSNPEIDGAYLIMPEFENLTFDGDYSEQKEEGYVSIRLEGGETIGFSTIEDIEFSELPAFISPKLSEISIQKEFKILNTEKISDLTLIILVVLLVSLLGFISYITMQQWYKRKYESHLFKNRNDLFNIVSYVHNMKKQGVEDRKVSLGLKKAGWNSEQVAYIMKKYYGKRTGMFEIPMGELFKFARHPKTSFGNSNIKNQNATQPRKI